MVREFVFPIRPSDEGTDDDVGVALVEAVPLLEPINASHLGRKKVYGFNGGTSVVDLDRIA